MTEPFMLDLHMYLGRLGYSSAPPPTLDTLRELQERHTAEFPFETLASMLRVPVEVEPAAGPGQAAAPGPWRLLLRTQPSVPAAVAGIGLRRARADRPRGHGRAGRCPASAYPYAGAGDPGGVCYITDVGFGRMVPTGPLLPDSEAEQATPHEPYRLTLVDDTYTLRALVADSWRAMYLFDLQKVADIDYVVGNWYVCTHPESPFLGQMIAARTGPGLRKTLNNGSFAIHRLGQASERVQLQSVDEVLRVLREEFGIRVPEHPERRQIIERLIAGA